MQRIKILFVFLILLNSCQKTPVLQDPNSTNESYYFPPLSGDNWDTKSAVSLQWDTTKLNAAFDYAGTKNTFGLIVLQNGRIVKEQYWNNWTKDTRYYIASAGKSVVAFLVGIAQQNGLLNINDKTSQYLGNGWTNLSLSKENLITLKNNLTMTTGLNDAVANPDCTDPSCLTYIADAGSRWAYHNAPYLLLQTVLANASGQTFTQFCTEQLYNKIGITRAFWYNNTMWCTTREAARFGSLILNKGKWDNNTLLADSSYFQSMVNTSQNLNKSYGYLWWLNGKSSFMVPTSQLVFNGNMAPDAPSDMIMALGKDDKKIYVVPSLNIVAVRLGDAAGNVTLGPSSFDNEFWARMKQAIGY
jgi:CubicO group peptidase (beta-lactamase class C family)